MYIQIVLMGTQVFFCDILGWWYNSGVITKLDCITLSRHLNHTTSSFYTGNINTCIIYDGTVLLYIMYPYC